MTPKTLTLRIQTAEEEQEEADSLPHTATLPNKPTPGFTTSGVVAVQRKVDRYRA
jgi:hypothetical protein